MALTSWLKWIGAGAVSKQVLGKKCRVCIDFRWADIAPAVSELGKRGLTLDGTLDLVAKMHDDHGLSRALFKDPDWQISTLMQAAPKGYSLQATSR